MTGRKRERDVVAVVVVSLYFCRLYQIKLFVKFIWNFNAIRIASAKNFYWMLLFFFPFVSLRLEFFRKDDDDKCILIYFIICNFERKEGKLYILFTSSPPFGFKVTWPFFDGVGVVLTTGVLSSLTFAFMLKVLTSSSSSRVLIVVLFDFCTFVIILVLVLYSCAALSTLSISVVEFYLTFYVVRVRECNSVFVFLLLLLLCLLLMCRWKDENWHANNNDKSSKKRKFIRNGLLCRCWK